MKCIRCGGKVKLKPDGWRRCGWPCGATELMGVDLRVAAFLKENPDWGKIPDQPASNEYKPSAPTRLPVTWRST